MVQVQRGQGHRHPAAGFCPFPHVKHLQAFCWKQPVRWICALVRPFARTHPSPTPVLHFSLIFAFEVDANVLPFHSVCFGSLNGVDLFLFSFFFIDVFLLSWNSTMKLLLWFLKPRFQQLPPAKCSAFTPKFFSTYLFSTGSKLTAPHQENVRTYNISVHCHWLDDQRIISLEIEEKGDLRWT